MSSRKASPGPGKSDWLCLDGTSAPPPEDGILRHRTPPGQEDGASGDDSSGDESDRQERILKELERKPRPRPPRPVVEGDGEEEEEGEAEISLSLGGLSLLDAFVPSQNNVEVRVIVYDLETTGLGATDKISIMELGGCPGCAFLSFLPRAA